jgi:hypothetical protein
MTTIAQELKGVIDAAKPSLLSISEGEASARPFSDKWSQKEILGHLIDSAANNHQRIVRMQEAYNIGSFTYSQQHWVKSQYYFKERWEDIVGCWYHYNLHLSHVISHVDPACLDNVCDMGYSEPAKLKFVIEDYVRHVQHHLDQIFSDVDPRERQVWIPRSPSQNQ